MDNNIDSQPPFNFPFRDSIRVTDALIQSVTTDRGTTFVTIEYDDCPACRNRMQVTLVVTRNTMIRDERGRTLPARDLEAGMVIDATFSQTMTRSIPPQTQAFQIRVKKRQPVFATTTGRILDVNSQEQFIRITGDTNRPSLLRFNITPMTQILDPIGRQIPLSNLFPGLRVRVEHATFMTASLPPQSPAFVIQIVR